MSNELTQSEIDELLRNISIDDNQNENIDSHSCPDCGIFAPKLLIRSESNVYIRIVASKGKVLADGGFPSGIILVCLKCSGRFIISNETKITRCRK